MLYAEVAVREDAPYRHAFTYSVPDDLALVSGQGVLVPFGPRILEGVVLRLSPTTGFGGAVRSVLGPAPELPTLLPHQVDLALWLAHRYLAPIFACVALMLPPALRSRLVPVDGIEPATDAQRAVLEAVRAIAPADLARLRRRLPMPELPLVVDQLLRRGALRREYTQAPRSPGPDIVDRAQNGGQSLPEAEQPALTFDQSLAVRLILGRSVASEDAEQGQRVSLLHGVTGSGKTEVYLAAAAETAAAGRRVLMLVPEIALTPQMIARFTRRFCGQVAVLHSGLSARQRLEQWWAVREGRYAIVIGSRSAIFAPAADVGLIVLDEEHEWTYKQQDQQPRYDARAVAQRLASLTGAKLVLGSATPDVVSYHRALSGHYQLVSLPRRLRPREDDGVWRPEALPPVEIADLSRELREGNRSIFSRSLAQALGETLARGEQAILFLNRRGAANIVLCRDCGHVPHCRRCAVSLTYHAATQRLLCHQCNRSRRATTRCPRCHSARFRFLGSGTERVEAEVLRCYPEARVVRWDRDSVRRASDHTRLFELLQRREADVLVGTQMIAKSLDLPGVTLVGIVNADITLNLPDYRSSERAFQLLTQVAGRAGRGERAGRVILQTYLPNHYALRSAAAHDYAAFYEQELAFRRLGPYPPFARLTRLVYAHSGERQAEEEARRLARQMRQILDAGSIFGSEVLGPVPCLVARLRGRWRWQLLLRSADPPAFLSEITLPQGWSVDVDPQTFS